jgi:hypothetical protein
MNNSIKAQEYFENLLKLYEHKDAGTFDSDEADIVLDKMVEQWYALSQIERHQMDTFVHNLNNEKQI